MYTITKEFHFSASHEVEELRQGHPCSRTHGHNYVVKVELKAKDLNSSSMVQDYGELSPIKDYIDKHLDHQHLNKQFAWNPTAENIAFHLYNIFKPHFHLLSAVEVSETPKTNCRYEPDNN